MRKEMYNLSNGVMYEVEFTRDEYRDLVFRRSKVRPGLFNHEEFKDFMQRNGYDIYEWMWMRFV
jgi:hypothetical protein